MSICECMCDWYMEVGVKYCLACPRVFVCVCFIELEERGRQGQRCIKSEGVVDKSFLILGISSGVSAPMLR